MYLEDENEKENHALGDVDPKAAEPNDFDFFFNLEDVKKKYADYLGLTPQDFEQTNDEDDGEEEGEESEERTDEQESEENDEESIEKDKLIDEIKTLNINNQEESNYIDHNYWKSTVEFDVDSLLNEL